MNTPIRRLSVCVLVLFAALLLQASQIIVVQQESLNANPQNRRVRDAQFGGHRGSIVAGKTVLAESQPASGEQFAYQRVYPAGELYAPITGFYSYDRGSTALEESYNAELAGTADSQFVRRFVDTLTGEAPQGATVETTIDPDAQAAAAKALGKMKGGVIALDVESGAILTMVTSPSYDPNDIAGHDIRAADEAYQALLKDSDAPLSNRATNEIYPPGSTFKLVTAAAALEDGVEPSTQIKTPAELTLPDTTTMLGNDTACGNTEQTLDRALQLSCNTAFANVGLDLGADKLRTQAEKFGWDYQLAEVNGAAARFPDDPDRPQTALSAIGQYDVAANPLHVAMVAAGIANDGVVMQPYLVQRIRGSDLRTLSETRPRRLSQAMSSDNATKLQDMMVNVVQDGTGTNARISGVRVGGKTGTAQSSPDRPPYAWFTSFAEGSDRTIAVAVFVESANVPRSEIGGNVVAAPIATAVMKELL